MKPAAPTQIRPEGPAEEKARRIAWATAMIDVTATMLPSTVMNDRSLAPQIAASAIFADSRNLFMARVAR